MQKVVNPLSANPTKWSNTLTQFVGNLPINCLSVFVHFTKLALKGLKTNFEYESFKVYQLTGLSENFKIKLYYLYYFQERLSLRYNILNLLAPFYICF